MNIVVNGKHTTTEAYRDSAWLTKDQYRDMEYSVAINGDYDAPNGDHVLRAAQP